MATAVSKHLPGPGDRAACPHLAGKKEKPGGEGTWEDLYFPGEAKLLKRMRIAGLIVDLN